MPKLSAYLLVSLSAIFVYVPSSIFLSPFTIFVPRPRLSILLFASAMSMPMLESIHRFASTIFVFILRLSTFSSVSITSVAIPGSLLFLSMSVISMVMLGSSDFLFFSTMCILVPWLSAFLSLIFVFISKLKLFSPVFSYIVFSTNTNVCSKKTKIRSVKRNN